TRRGGSPDHRQDEPGDRRAGECLRQATLDRHRWVRYPARRRSLMGELPSQEPRKVVVTGPTAGFRTEVEVGGHHLVVDEPIPVGGPDEGPSPYETLLAALGACTAMTLRIYADRRKWPLARAKITLQHHKVHVQDCIDCDQKQARIDVVERIITLEGSLT